jgi:ABC-type phosphate/phosphonate transport system substrate-binding protein
MIMKRVFLLSAILVFSLFLTACQNGEEVDEATADSCAKLGDFGTRLTEFGQELSQFDSPDEAAADPGVQQAMADMQQALDEFKAGASTEQSADELEAAADELEQAFRSATEGMSRKELAAAATETFDLFNSECNIVNFGRPG